LSFFLEFLTKTSLATGIILDATYTGKAAFGIVDLMNKRPEVFTGHKVMFVHTGTNNNVYFQMNEFLCFATERTNVSTRN
jgi:1-aminocyclopropane-1-carboxylate deaminase/D-cysteine desulfhydrase-like pyridoxal-dependent ACC family enzyme